MTKLKFDTADVFTKLTGMDRHARDQLDFGVVEFDADGVVSAYNQWEAELSGLRAESVLGQNFFVDIASCTNNFMVSQKYLDNEELDETMPYTFTVRMKPTVVRLRLLRSANTAFLLVERA